MTVPPLTSVASSNLAAIGYDPATETLYVAFKAKPPAVPALYAYDGVPPAVPVLLWDVHQRGGSLGAALNEHVKRPGFAHRRLPDLAEVA